MRRSLKRALGCAVVVGLLAAAAAAVAGWWAWGRLGDPYRGFPGEEAVVVIEPGTSSTPILERLEREGVIADARLARAWLIYGMGDPPLQAGEYRFAGRSSARQVLAKLVAGEVVDHPVTVVEGLDMAEIAAALTAAGLGDEEAFLAAMHDPAPIAELDPEAEDLEGYLFPSTYRFPRTMSERDIVATMVRTFRERWRAEVEPLGEGAPATSDETQTAAAPVAGETTGVPAAADPTEVADAAASDDGERPANRPDPGGGAGAGPAADRGGSDSPPDSPADRTAKTPAPGASPPAPEAKPGSDQAGSLAAGGEGGKTGSPAGGSPTGSPAAASPAGPAPRRRTVREIVTLASIVEKEAKVPEERPLIAGVYRNRLRRGIALYADPTVIYALKKLGRWDGNIRRADLQLDSPYNTYRHAGLPPGPIANPGLASLKAAAAPADVRHLYFVSRNDGTHVFADTLAEHNRNVERWQKRYWRERRAEERRRAEEQGETRREDGGGR